MYNALGLLDIWYIFNSKKINVCILARPYLLINECDYVYESNFTMNQKSTESRSENISARSHKPLRKHIII